jgi:hypothetical protein
MSEVLTSEGRDPSGLPAALSNERSGDERIECEDAGAMCNDRVEGTHARMPRMRL